MPDLRGRAIDAEKLREILIARLWTLQRLADEAGVSYRTVKNAARDGTPHVVRELVAKAFANALGCDVDDFSTPVGATPRPGAASVICSNCDETLGHVPSGATARRQASALHRDHTCTTAAATTA